MIVDAHHHLWDHPGNRYFLPDLLDDVTTGHDIRATVAVECGAMYRRDWSEKPNGETFRRLVHEVWRSAAAGRTDDDGRFATRAFYGQYEVTVTWRGQTRVMAVDHLKGDRPSVVRVEF